MKTCTRCTNEKEISNFFRDSSRIDGYMYVCKKCKSLEKASKCLKDIIQRCLNENNKSYHRYGGRGIKCLITVDELKELWVRDNASEMQRPSIDRKDNNGDYTFENCQFIELSINSGKDKIKPILQYNKDMQFIKEWNSILEAQNIYGHGIITCLTKRDKTAYGFIWRYKNEQSYLNPCK